MPCKIVIIGAHAAGVDAASAARKIDRKAEITLITKESVAGYSRCGIPFVLAGEIMNFEDLIVFPRSYFEMMKLNLKLNTTVTKIDTKSKLVIAEGKNGVEEIPYDKLILTTGARPFVPPIEGRDKQGVFTVRTLGDGKKIEKAMRKAKSAVVIGAGLIGLEVAAALVRRGIKTTVVELLPQVLPTMLDPDMAEIVKRKLEEKGLKIILNTRVDEILGKDKVEKISMNAEKTHGYTFEELPADMVIVATGIRPNVELAKEAGIAIGETKGIKTNSKMETSIEDVFAAGDCAETINPITSYPTLNQLGTTAVRQARVAGINAAGGDVRFNGVIGTAVTKLFDFEVGATGLTENTAKKLGIDVTVATITSKTRASYYPGALPIKIKIVAEKETNRIIGAQIIGGEAVTQRINMLSLAIRKRMTLEDLANMETCYAPPLSETWEPIVLAALYSKPIRRVIYRKKEVIAVKKRLPKKAVA